MTAELWTILITSVVAFLGAVTALIKSRMTENARAETKIFRDKDSMEIHDAILKHTMQIAQLKDNQAMHATVIEDLRDVTNSLNTNVAKLGVVVEGLTDAVKELKNR